MFTVCQKLSKLFTFINTFHPQNHPIQTSALTIHTVGIINLPKRHREGPSFHSHEIAEFGFKSGSQGQSLCIGPLLSNAGLNEL